VTWSSRSIRLIELFEITRRTITRTVRAASGTRSSGAGHSRMRGRRMRMTRIRARSSTRASFLPSSFELAGIVIEYARNVAAEYAISQMIRENSDRPDRFYASASRCTAPSRQENEEREMTIGDADRKCPTIDIKTFTSVTFQSNAHVATNIIVPYRRISDPDAQKFITNALQRVISSMIFRSGNSLYLRGVCRCVDWTSAILRTIVTRR